MTASLFAALLIIAGLLLCLKIGTEDFLQPFSGIRERRKRIRTLAGKPPGKLSQLTNNAAQMLEASGMKGHLVIYKRLALILGIIGALFGVLIGNLLAAGVMGVGFACIPILIIRVRTGDYLRHLHESLESGMSTITNAYVASGDLISAVGDNLHLLPSPVDQVFKQFASRTQFIDASIPKALQAMKEQIDNRYWREWVNVLIQCQGDRTLRFALPGIAERLGDMRRIQMEADTLLRKQISDYVLTVFILLGSIPVMSFMMPDWYDALTQTVVGQIVLAVVLAAVFATAVWIGKLYRPIEGGEPT